MNNNGNTFTRKARELLGLINDAQESLANADIPSLKQQIGVIEKGVTGAINQFNAKIAPLLKNIKSGPNIKKSFFGGYSLNKTPRISQMDDVLRSLKDRSNRAKANANAGARAKANANASARQTAQEKKNANARARANANALARQAAQAKKNANAERNSLARNEKNKLKAATNAESLKKTLNALRNKVGTVNAVSPRIEMQPIRKPNFLSSIQTAKAGLRPVAPPLSANRSTRIANAARNAIGATGTFKNVQGELFKKPPMSMLNQIKAGTTLRPAGNRVVAKPPSGPSMLNQIKAGTSLRPAGNRVIAKPAPGPSTLQNNLKRRLMAQKQASEGNNNDN